MRIHSIRRSGTLRTCNVERRNPIPAPAAAAAMTPPRIARRASGAASSACPRSGVGFLKPAGLHRSCRGYGPLGRRLDDEVVDDYFVEVATDKDADAAIAENGANQVCEHFPVDEERELLASRLNGDFIRRVSLGHQIRLRPRDQV